MTNPSLSLPITRLALGLFAASFPLITQAAASLPVWERHAFSLPESIWSVEAADVNGDGKPDLVAIGITKVYALTAPDWKVHELFDIQEGKMLYCVALDVDHDGDKDLVLGRYAIPWIDYRQAQAEGKALPPMPKGPDFSVAWIENTGNPDRAWPLHVIDRELNGVHGLCLADVDADGRPDVIAQSISGPFFANSVVWFQNPAPGQSVMTRHVVTRGGTDGRPHYLDFADLNGDRRGDILLGDSGAGTFTWWERGASLDQPWTKHLVAQEKGATNIKAADLNRDGKPDIVGTAGHGKGVYWFEGPDWKRHAIDADLTNPHSLALADFDGDGHPDIAVESYTAFVARWYHNDGRGNFTAQEFDSGHKQQSYDMKVADLDGDGRPDLIMAGRESNNVVWYRNGAQ
jgi:hypothetical protein